MKFGVIVGNSNAIDSIAEFAVQAENCGFDHFLLSDHYWFPDEPDLVDSWAVLGYLAALTSTIRLGTCVSPITFRPPLQFAKVVSTVDVASHGRIIVGVGAGWFEDEFRMFSQWRPNKERIEQFQEALQILITAWTKKSLAFPGKYYKVVNCVVEPKPVQKPYPPLWFGGWGPRIMRLAGKMGDGWIPTGPRSGEAVKSPDEYRKCIGVISKGLDESGRKAEQFAFGCRFGPLETPREHLGEIEAFASVGLTHYQLGINVRKSSPTVLRSFSDSVVSCF